MEEVGVETSLHQSEDEVEVDLQASGEENVIEKDDVENEGLNDAGVCVEGEDELDDEDQLGYKDYLENNNDHEDDQESNIGINLFVDLHSMGLEIDQSTIRDLCSDFVDEDS